MIQHTTEIVCPHCWHAFEDSWQYVEGKEQIGEVACGDCGQAFYARRNIWVSYSTETLAERRGLS